MDGFTIYGFSKNNLMAKNALLDLDTVKEEISKLLKDKTGAINSAVIQILKETNAPLTLEEILEKLPEHKLKLLPALFSNCILMNGNIII